MAYKIAASIMVLFLHICNLDAQSTTTVAVSPAPSSTAVLAGTSAATPLPGATPSASPAIATGATADASAASSVIAPTPTVSVAPTASKAPEASSDIKLTIIAIVQNTSCNGTDENTIKTAIEKTYPVSSYSTKMVKVTLAKKGENCQANVTVIFGAQLNATDIVTKAKALEEMGSFSIVKGTLEVDVGATGIKVTAWVIADGECADKCCKNNGEPVTMKQTRTRTCENTPSNLCGMVPREQEKLFGKCLDVCTCSGATFKISLILLLVSLVINRFFL